MRIVVTGGSGFIGTRLVGALLKNDHDVVIFDKNPSAVFPDCVCQGDVRDPAALAQALASAEVVFHLAAEHADDVRPISLYQEVNVGGAHNLVAAATQHAVTKIIFTSTVAIYGLNAGVPTEEATANPFNPYGQSKYEAETVLQEWGRGDTARSLTIVRPCVIFGEGNRGNVYNLLEQIHRRRFIPVGRGTNRKSMGYVGNLADFLTVIMPLARGIQTYNYADKPDLTTAELVTIARKAFGHRAESSFAVPYWAGLTVGYAADALACLTRKCLPISAVRIKKFCADTTIDARRLETTGFVRPYTLEEGLQRMIAAEFGPAAA